MPRTESVYPREVARSAEGLVTNPPGIILVMDNYRGPKTEQKEMGEKTMELRSGVAALIYHSTLYDAGVKPIVCAFAGEHEPQTEPGSVHVARYLHTFAIHPEDIVVRATTITTNTDIMQLHSFMKDAHAATPAAIITTDDHIKRTEQELANHFNAHRREQAPAIYVIGPDSDEVMQLQYDPQNAEFIHLLKNRVKILRGEVSSHGMTEAIANLLASSPLLKRYVQPFAEKHSHPHTPERLQRIEEVYKLLTHMKNPQVKDLEPLISTL